MIYLDEASTTFVSSDVVENIEKVMTNSWGNPSSLYELGLSSKEILDDSRKTIAKLLNCSSSEIYFTSCGSESDTMAVMGYALANSNKGHHIISTCVEHHAVMNSLKSLKSFGFEISYLHVDSKGNIDLDELKSLIRKDTILICMMYVNNEIGTIYPIKEAAKIAHEHEIAFFTDAVQAVSSIKIDCAELGIDMLAISGHKFHAPKGVACLFIKKGIKVNPIIHGGKQEKGLRGGTENVPFISGMAVALTGNNFNISNTDSVNITRRVRDEMISRLLRIDGLKINGTLDNRVCNNINCTIDGVNGELLTYVLSIDRIYISIGSACNAGTLSPSHVLKAIGLSDTDCTNTIRMTLPINSEYSSDINKDFYINFVINKINSAVERMRAKK